MNTLYLQYILTVAECGSINKAAQQLTLKTQYLSRVIKNMEDELQIQIFQRHSRGVDLTEDGHIFLKHAKIAVDAINQMYLQYQYPSKQPYNKEKITLNLYIPPLLYPTNINKSIATYHEFFPNVKINYIESYLDTCSAALLQHPYAIALQPLYTPNGNLPPGLKIRKLYASTLVALTSKQTALQQNLTKLSIQEVLKKELIFFSHSKIEQSALYQGITKYGTPNIVSVIGNQTIFIDTLESGSYFAIGTSRTAQHNENIAAIPITDFNDFFVPVVAIMREDIADSPMIRDFINTILLQLGEPIV